MVVRQAMMLAAAGIVIGLAAAYGLTRLMASLLFQVKPNDPAVFASVAAILAAVALLASYLPATARVARGSGGGAPASVKSSSYSPNSIIVLEPSSSMAVICCRAALGLRVHGGLFELLSRVLHLYQGEELLAAIHVGKDGEAASHNFHRIIVQRPFGLRRPLPGRPE